MRVSEPSAAGNNKFKRIDTATTTPKVGAAASNKNHPHGLYHDLYTELLDIVTSYYGYFVFKNLIVDLNKNGQSRFYYYCNFNYEASRFSTPDSL